MLNATNLSGFGEYSQDIVFTRVGAFDSTGTETSKTHTVTLPANTYGLVITSITNMNAYTLRTVTSITVDGVAATKITDTTRLTEYRSHAALWISNVPNANSSVSVVVTNDVSAAFGGTKTYIWAVNKKPRMTCASYGTDNAGDPLQTAVSFYKDGLAVAQWVSYAGTVSISPYFTCFGPDCGLTGQRYGLGDYYPTSDIGSTTISAEDGSGNYSQSLVIGSFSPADFV